MKQILIKITILAVVISAMFLYQSSANAWEPDYPFTAEVQIVCLHNGQIYKQFSSATRYPFGNNICALDDAELSSSDKTLIDKQHLDNLQLYARSHKHDPGDPECVFGILEMN